MCKAIKTSEFREEVIKQAKNKDRNLIFNYLRSIGCIINNRDGKLNVTDNWKIDLKFMTSDIEVGDIAWTETEGLALIIDTHPEANNDGHHYRALKVAVQGDGSHAIIGDRRSILIDGNSAIRIRKTTFNIKRIDYLSYERYLAYKRIKEIDEELKQMKEV